MSHAASILAAAHGGMWDEHPDWPVEDWVSEVYDNTTRLSYWDWVLNHLEDTL